MDRSGVSWVSGLGWDLMLGTLATRASWNAGLLGYAWRYRTVVALVAVGLASRLPLLSVSLDEVDAANFVNALSYGYDIPQMRPHPPGSPVYVFLGWLVNLVFDDPLRTLTLLSAVLGSLAVIPFYSLARQFTDERLALAGSLIFVVNPLLWSFSETALSDTPSMFFAVSLAWLCYRAKDSDMSFLWASVVASLAIGMRQPNAPLLLLLAFPIGYRLLISRRVPWRPLLLGSVLFVATSAAWAVPMVVIGTDGIGDYLAAVNRQWSTTVNPYDFTQIESPFVPNLLLRVARFFLGYFLLYPWTASDAKTAVTLLLIVPWIFGFGLFLTGFTFRKPQHVFIALWLVSIAYPILAIHFLPRYGLSQLPGFIIASLIGYHFLAQKLPRHPRSLYVVAILAIGCVFVLYGIKYQAPVNTFEYSPAGGIEVVPAVFFTLGGLSLLGAIRLYRLRPSDRLGLGSGGPDDNPATSGTGLAATVPAIVVIGLLALVVPYSIRGYSSASIAHNRPSPNHRLVEYVSSTFDVGQITSCWDNQTHSFFDALVPRVVPRPFESLEELSGVLEAGTTLVFTNRCKWFDWLEGNVGLAEVATFTGDSPVWSKTPLITLYVYVADPAARTPSLEPPARRVLD